MADTLIALRDLSFSYDDVEHDANPHYVIRHLNLTIDRGSYVCILGHNGSGKSTLAKLMNLILLPDEGCVEIDGKPVSDDGITEDELFECRRRIGMVFQNPDNQLVATIVEEDVAFGPENLGVAPKEIRRRVDAALETVGMTEYAKHSPHQLSGGQKQRVAIAGVIAMEPECIIFDESTAMLDPIGRRELTATIGKLNRDKGITVIHITHNMDEAVLADRVVVIDDGKIVLDGTPKQVFSKVDALRSVGLDVPQTTELFYDLRADGWNLPGDILNEEEGAEVLAALFADYAE